MGPRPHSGYSVMSTDGATANGGGPLVELQNLKVYFPIKSGVVLDRHVGDIRAVDDVSLQIKRGETVGLVGESGCGKSTVGRTIVRLYKPTAGRILFEGTDLIRQSDRALRRIRGRDISMIFQDPMTSLNPVLTIGRQIRETLETHFDMSRKDANKRAAELLDRVGIPSADQRLRDYPHQFSGGMRQRAMIAMALACEPKLLIADEPTTALDVTIQAQILELLREIGRAHV